jgi:hypothetical protein
MISYIEILVSHSREKALLFCWDATRMVLEVDSNISEEHTASIFRA